MLIIKIVGGLGNQMFQYAIGQELLELGYQVKYDISEFKRSSIHNGYELERIFGIKLNLATVAETATHNPSLINKILRSLKLKYGYIRQHDFAYHPKYLKLNPHRNFYLDGYWQSEKYFQRSLAKIKQQLVFSKLDFDNEQYLTIINNNNSIAIHVRRGDYVNHPLHGGICDLNYYHQAIKFMKDQVSNPYFIVFSNDITWCKINLKLDNALYITGNNKINSYKDMQLMSQCKYNIIANSSFSWWGAYLNNYIDKIVIAPKIWFNKDSYDTKDLLPSTWIKL